MLDEAFLEALQSVRWFERCGQRVTTALPFPVDPVFSWEEAVGICSEPTWEDTTLQARNNLTLFLHHHARSEYQRWNEVAIAAKQRCVLPLAETMWEPFSRLHGLGPVFVDCVRWDILAAIMEHEYRHVADRPTFFLHLLTLYQAGHFPCGWTGRFPEGSLLVY